jgi:FtsZ-interacting cell division protein ZipA
MSELQISLLVIGVAVIAAVLIFNLIQERRFRRSLEDSFKPEREDALLKVQADDAGRVEPQLQESPIERLPLELLARRKSDTDSPLPDETIDYVAVIHAQEPVAERDLADLLGKVAVIGCPYRAMALNAGNGSWEDLTHADGGSFTSLRVALQLVGRSGAVTSEQLAKFDDIVKNFAAAHGAVVTCPDSEAALNAAKELDAFCNEVDIAIGVNVMARKGCTFAGSRIRAIAEEAGFTLEPDGVFHLRDAQLRTLFTLSNHGSAAFIPGQIAALSTGGVTLLLDVPLVQDGVSAFDRMFEMGTRLSRQLDGELVDDNRMALNANAAAAIRKQLTAIHQKMQARGISPGSALAMRLFS